MDMVLAFGDVGIGTGYLRSRAADGEVFVQDMFRFGDVY
jgi:hypothetical protein